MIKSHSKLISAPLLCLFAFALLLVASSSASAQKQPEKEKPPTSDNTLGIGSGSSVNAAGLSDASAAPTPASRTRKTTSLRIITKPKGEYTPVAREKGVTGEVVLRVEFLPDGTIGEIKVVKGLPHGLTDQAVEAARKMRFEPAKKNGRPIKTVRNVSYNFIIY